MIEPLITVICPAYNVEKYIKKCVDSIQNQTYKNLEILLIDDGSTDTTGRICDEFARNDKRIRVFHKENGGLSSARNLGLDNAHGEYLAFVDSDDYIDSEMYETLLKILVREDADFVGCSFFDDYGTRKVQNGGMKTTSTWQGEDIFLHRTELRFLAWNKLYKRSLVGEQRFVLGQVYEDVHFNAPLFFKAKKVAYYDACLYNYRIARPGNTNSSFKPGRLCIFKEFDNIVQELEKHGYLKARASMLLYMLSFYRRLYKEAWQLKAGKKVRKKIYKNFHRCFMKAHSLNIKLDKGSWIFCFAPVLLSIRDLNKQKRSEKGKQI